MRIYQPLALGLLFAFTSATNLAASFDCDLVHTPVEKAICTNPTLSRMDDEMARLYQTQWQQDPNIKSQQLYWLREVRGKCTSLQCLEAAYQTRIQQLTPAALSSDTPFSSSHIEQAEPADYLTCPLNWSALQGLKTASLDQPILGIRVRDWKKSHITRMLAREENCQRHSQESDYVKNTILEEVRQQQYPAALAALEIRDQRMANALANDARPENLSLPIQQSQVHEESQPKVIPALPLLPQNHNPSWLDKLLGTLALVGFAGLGIWIWHTFFRRRCPACRSTHYDPNGVTEIDRWRGTKQVSEKNSRGVNTRHVQTTFVKNLYAYRCRDCQHHWTEERKEEL